MISDEAQRLAARSPYGWGHSLTFPDGSRIDGLLGEAYLDIARHLDEYRFWPRALNDLVVADVGCFSGGLSLLMAQRNARQVFAIDELPRHVEQCRLTVRAFGADHVVPIETSIYQLESHLPAASLDLILCSGVLYHLSDMLVGLVILQTLLKPGGVLLIESNAIDDFERSYANFGRFYAGMWWQPSALCIVDMLDFTGFATPDIRFYLPQRCLARAVKPTAATVPFKRGMNYRFADINDERPRTLDPSVMRPAKG